MFHVHIDECQACVQSHLGCKLFVNCRDDLRWVSSNRNRYSHLFEHYGQIEGNRLPQRCSNIFRQKSMKCFAILSISCLCRIISIAMRHHMLFFSSSKLFACSRNPPNWTQPSPSELSLRRYSVLHAASDGWPFLIRGLKQPHFMTRLRKNSNASGSCQSGVLIDAECGSTTITSLGHNPGIY